MKKITSFVIGVMMTLPLFANNYTKNLTTGMYDYAGDSAVSVSLDFTTWQASDMYDAAVGADYVSGAHSMTFVDTLGCGFQKWVIYPNRWFATGVNKTALFNNSKNTNEVDSLDQAAIYFPPIKGGVKTISVTGRRGNQPLVVLGYNETAAEWQDLGLMTIDATYTTYTFDVKQTDICRVALYCQKGNTAYTSITHINISSMKEEEIPISEDLYILDPITGTYSYNGEPVEAINIDFTSWSTSDLPSSLTDDMALEEVEGYGFVKWKIAAYNTENVLFNNNTGDAGVTIANNSSTNPPAIYFPTTVRGVDSLVITTATNNYWVKVYWNDDEGSHSQNVNLSVAGKNIVHINSTGQTTVYIINTSTSWVRIKGIDFTLVEPSTPTGINNANDAAKVTKQIENGQLVIIKNGVRYNVLGSKF